MTTVALFPIMMDWTPPLAHGGTDYTCMDCVDVFAMMFGAGLSYWLASEGGYGKSFGVALPLIGLSVFAVWRLYKSIQQNEPHGDLSAKRKPQPPNAWAKRAQASDWLDGSVETRVECAGPFRCCSSKKRLCFSRAACSERRYS